MRKAFSPLVTLFWFAPCGCSRSGTIENGTLIMGPGVFEGTNAGVGWDGVTLLPQGILDEVAQSIEDGDAEAALDVYAKYSGQIPAPELTGYVGYKRRHLDLQYYRTDSTGFQVQFVTGSDVYIGVDTTDELHLTLFEPRISTEVPIVDLDLGVNWRDCWRADDDGHASWFYYNETDYRLLWYSVVCLGGK